MSSIELWLAVEEVVVWIFGSVIHLEWVEMGSGRIDWWGLVGGLMGGRGLYVWSLAVVGGKERMTTSVERTEWLVLWLGERMYLLYPGMFFFLLSKVMSFERSM